MSDIFLFLLDYASFLLKTITLLGGFIAAVAIVALVGQKAKKASKGHLEINKLNDHFKEMKEALEHELTDKDELKKKLKAEKKAKKKNKKAPSDQEANTKPKVFVIDFHGDIKASAVTSLREEITAILAVATKSDEVVVRLESSGGLVHAYGLAASQLCRIRNKGVKLTVAIDKVAASGGYMMACTADHIVSAPFAVIGSIGVMAQLPNFNKILKKHDVELELHTAGEFKRTLTVLGENTEKGREKFKQDIEETHGLFKQFISEQRSQVDIEQVATGEIWYGQQAIDKQLIDQLATSDEYILNQAAHADVTQVAYVMKKGVAEKIGLTALTAIDTVLTKWWSRLSSNRFFT